MQLLKSWALRWSSLNDQPKAARTSSCTAKSGGGGGGNTILPRVVGL
jgi:hypothetical protein